MNAITVKILMDQPICTSVAWVIKAPAPIGVVAAIAPNPPKNRRRVPIVSIASRKEALLEPAGARMNGIKIYSLENHDPVLWHLHSLRAILMSCDVTPR